MKKRRDYKKLALAGLTSGLLLSGQISAHDNSKKESTEKTDPNAGNLNYHMMTEDELLLQLSPEGIKIYKSLTPEGKSLALKVASAACDGTNECAGLNACKTDKNDCAGKAKCKGQSKCSLDKDLAMRLVKKKMDEMSQKRDNAANGKK